MAEKQGDLMVVTVDVRTGRVVRADGVELANVKEFYSALDRLTFRAIEVTDYKEVQQAFLKKPADNFAVIYHTESSPGCSWEMQDGWYRKVCN